MNSHDTQAAAVLDAVKDSLDGVTMHTPVEQIVTAGHVRRRRRRLIATATGVAAVTGLTLGVPVLSSPPAGRPGAVLSTAAGSVHIRTAAFSVDSYTDGTVHVTWDKKRYFQDHQGLQQALRDAGFPALVKEGVFCQGPQDNGYLDPSGVGPGVDQVMQGD